MLFPLLRARGQYKEAIRDFSAAIRLRPAFGDPYKRRGQVYGALGKVRGEGGKLLPPGSRVGANC